MRLFAIAADLRDIRIESAFLKTGNAKLKQAFTHPPASPATPESVENQASSGSGLLVFLMRQSQPYKRIGIMVAEVGPAVLKKLDYRAKSTQTSRMLCKLM